MPTQALSNSWAQVDSASTDVLALLAASGLAKDIRLENGNKLQGLTVGAALVDMAYVNAADELVYGEAGADIVMISDGVLLSPTGTATGAPNASGDDLVIDGAGNRGLSIIAGNANFSSIYFGDPDDTNEASIQYSNSGDTLRLNTGSAPALTISASQNVEAPGGDFTVSGGFFGYGAAEALTIAAGVATATKSNLVIDTEAAAASDDLDTINGGSTGDVLVCGSANAARDVVFKDGTGNLALAGDFTAGNSADRLTLQWSGTAWAELSRSTNV